MADSTTQDSTQDSEEFFNRAPTSDIEVGFRKSRSPIDAIFEVIDNSISAAVARGRGQVNLELNFGDDQLIVRDNAGGIRKDNLKLLFRYGSSGYRDESDVLSQFGIGLKAAASVLAEDYWVYSNREGFDTTWGAGLSDDVGSNGWARGRVFKPTRTLDEGVTVVKFVGVEDFDLESLREKIGSVYHNYISGEGYCGTQASIVVNGKEVNSVKNYEFTYTPFWLYPRKYPNFELSGKYMDEEFEEGVEVSVTVGMLLGGENRNVSKHAGVDVYMQGRLVEENITKGEELFGSSSRLSKPSPREDRYKVVVEIHAKGGDGDKLPWDDTKTSVRPNGGVWREVRDIVQNISEAYGRGYGSMNAQQLNPFDSSHDCAVNNGEIQVYDDYGDRAKIRSGEKVYWYESNNGIAKKSKQLLEVVERHERARILAPDAVINEDFFPDVGTEYEKREAYKTLVVGTANSSNGVWSDCLGREVTRDDFTTLKDEPQRLEEFPERVVAKIKNSAIRDSKESSCRNRPDAEWKKVLYDYHHADSSGSNSVELSNVPDKNNGDGFEEIIDQTLEETVDMFHGRLDEKYDGVSKERAREILSLSIEENSAEGLRKQLEKLESDDNSDLGLDTETDVPSEIYIQQDIIEDCGEEPASFTASFDATTTDFFDDLDCEFKTVSEGYSLSIVDVGQTTVEFKLDISGDDFEPEEDVEIVCMFGKSSTSYTSVTVRHAYMGEDEDENDQSSNTESEKTLKELAFGDEELTEYHESNLKNMEKYDCIPVVKKILSDYDLEDILLEKNMVLEAARKLTRKHGLKKGKSSDNFVKNTIGTVYEVLVYTCLVKYGEKHNYRVGHEVSLDSIDGIKSHDDIPVDADVVMWDNEDSDSSVYILSLKKTLRERLKQSGLWQTHMRISQSDKVTAKNLNLLENDLIVENKRGDIYYGFMTNSRPTSKLNRMFDYAYTPKNSKSNQYAPSKIIEHMKNDWEFIDSL